MIAIDWGTSNFRAFRIDHAGVVFERRSFPTGILGVENGRFAEVLAGCVGDWLAAGENRVLLSGMIGSRQGWVEAGYVSCPARMEDLADGLIEVPFERAKAAVVPGVAGIDSDGVPEVMRGEETEVMGVLEDCVVDGLICLPGTHSKWVQVKNGAIDSFRTWMTGEIFSAVRTCTILGRMMTSGSLADHAAFEQGVGRSADDGGLLHHLFGVRTLGLQGEVQENSSQSYLSGLLIGHEVRAAMPIGAHVHLVGAAELCRWYSAAIEICGGSSAMGHDDAAALGLAAIGRRVSWI